MKTVFLLLWCFLPPLFAMSQQDFVLQRKIDSMLQVDQRVQTDMIDAYQRNAEQSERDSMEKIKDDAFIRHIPLLKEIIRDKGLPTYKLVGKESSDNFMTMVNHSFSDIAFQQQVIKLANAEVKEKNISAPGLAMMTDKMKIKSGQQQLYGTQCDYIEGKAVAKNLYKPRDVDKRRRKMGLPPLKEYLKMMTELHEQMNRQK